MEIDQEVEDTQVDWALLMDSARKLADLKLVVKGDTNDGDV
jgi:hypothetical protein